LNRFKRRLVYLALVALAVWPALHIGLVLRYDVNAWKLAGWGMYSTPQLAAYVRVSGLTPDEIGVYELRSIRPALQPARDEFLERRRGLRKLVEPDGFAHALLEHYTALDGVIIEVVQPTLNPRTGMIEETSVTYEYRR
jgi:hypothetical protein